jgi:hypothetical protein
MKRDNDSILDEPITPDPTKEHDAALTVCEWAGDVGVAREVLAMLGLVS